MVATGTMIAMAFAFRYVQVHVRFLGILGSGTPGRYRAWCAAERSRGHECYGFSVSHEHPECFLWMEGHLNNSGSSSMDCNIRDQETIDTGDTVECSER